MIPHSTRLKIRQFAKKHDLDASAQRDQLIEEVGELFDAMRTGTPEEVEEEFGDVEFVLRTLEYLADEEVDIDIATRRVTDQNIKKNDEKEGGKVTKSTE